jgi:hypothetical protein
MIVAASRPSNDFVHDPDFGADVENPMCEVPPGQVLRLLLPAHQVKRGAAGAAQVPVGGLPLQLFCASAAQFVTERNPRINAKFRILMLAFSCGQLSNGESGQGTDLRQTAS